MRKQFIAGPVLILTLSGLLVWRVRSERAQNDALPGGSATVEGVEVVVSSNLPTRITKIHVEEGDKVKAGQLLAELDCKDQEAALESAKSRVTALEAQVEVGKATVKSDVANASVSQSRVEVAVAQTKVLSIEQEQTQRDKVRADELGKTGSISTEEVEKAANKLQSIEEQKRQAEANVKSARVTTSAAKTAVATAEAQVAAGEAAVAGAKMDLHHSELDVAECKLVAPRDGVITARLLEPGAVVVPGSRVLTVLDMSTAKVTFFLPNAELGRAKIDAPAEVRADAFPGKVFKGKVRRIASEAEFTPRNVQTREDRDRLVYAVEVYVDNPDGELRAGMPADVVLVGAAQ